METVVPSQSQDEEELRLLLDWDRPADRSRWQRASSLSVALHVLLILTLFLLPREATSPPREEVRRFTPLIAPPEEITQRKPNRGKISKDFNIEALLPRPRLQIPRSSPPVAPAAPAPSTAATRQSVAPLPEPPKIEAATRDNQPKASPEAPPPPPAPQIQAQEKPKLAFETPGGPPVTNRAPGITKPVAPVNAVDEAVRNLAHGGSSGGVVVGEVGPAPGGGIGEGISQQPLPGKQGSALELLSDPMGVDFKPYLLQILSAVRRNWFAVMPESARFGRRGKVALQFAISRDGNVVKIVFAANSGAESLDRAAVASISMANPFPPLPSEFRGNQIRLQFTFQYNMPTN